MKKVIVFGNNSVAKMLYHETKKYCNDFKIIAFTVDDGYLESDTFCGLPLVGLSNVKHLYPPSEYHMISTVDAPSKLRNRIEVFNRLKNLGYTLCNYTSPLSDVADDVELGENNIIFANCHIGVGGVIGNANLIHQNVYLAHDFKIGNGNTFAGGSAIAGKCSFGDSCFIGIGATIRGNIVIADETLLGAGSVLVMNTQAHTKYIGNPAKPVGEHKETGIMLNT